MKTFQTLLVKVARTPENEAILEKISKKEPFPANNLHNFSGNKNVYFTSETTSLGLAIATQKMLLRTLEREKKAFSVEQMEIDKSKNTMFLPIIIAKYLINNKKDQEQYTKEIEVLENVPFQSIQLAFVGEVKEKTAFNKAIKKMKLAKK